MLAPSVVDLGIDDVAAAARLLRDAVPATCVGLAPYDSPRFENFLASALTLPSANRTVLLRGCRIEDTVAAVADWRLLGSTLFLNGIAVASRSRGDGLGRALIADGTRLAETTGCHQIELDVDESNAPAMRLYDRCGFDAIAASAWVEREIPSAQAGGVTDTPCRIRNWPAFTSQFDAYGFADLEVEFAAGGFAVRVLPAGWRIPATAPVGVKTGLGQVLVPPSRIISVVSADGEPATWSLARLRRMRLSGLASR